MAEGVDISIGHTLAAPDLASTTAATALSAREAERLKALHRYDILDTDPDTAFDAVVRTAAQVCRTPSAAISFVDEVRQWFKARVDVGVSETSRRMSLCTHAIEEGGLYVVPDVDLHPAFQDQPLIMGEAHVRFYAGAVLTTAEGFRLGSLCVMDTAPRPQGLTPDQGLVLQALAYQVMTQLELRRVITAERTAASQLEALAAAREVERETLRASEARLQLAMQAGQVGAWDWDVAARRLHGDAEIAASLAITPAIMAAGLGIDDYIERIHVEDRGWVVGSIDEAVRAGGEFTNEYRLYGAAGPRWVLVRGRGYLDASGQPSHCIGIAIDITERKRTEEALREANAGRELAMQAAHLGRFDHNPSTGRYFWDARCRQILGLPGIGRDGVFKTLAAVLHPEDRDKVAVALEQAVNPDRVGGYAEEYRIVSPETGETRWVSALGRSTFEDGRCVRFVGVLEDITERKLAEAHQQLLTHELNHRVKNTLAVVQAIVSESLRTAPTPQAARRAIADRLIALSRAHDILTRTNWSAAPIGEIVANAAQGLGVSPARIRLEGPARRLAPKAALSLAMALHELGTNAVKYGALSNDDGHVEVRWAIPSAAGGPRLTMRWSEHDGPAVVASSRQGFGSKLIEIALAREFNGSSVLAYPPSGAVWTLDAPLAAIEEPEPPSP